MPTLGEVGEVLRRVTVQIRAGQNSSGSGVVWDGSGRIITNAHVASSDQLRVELWDGRNFEARLTRRDSRRDLAEIRVEERGLQSAVRGDSDTLRSGELVIAVGNPLGFTGALSTGVVHGVGAVRGLGSRPYVQAAVRLAPGNSGGPLANASGKVIGINTMVTSGGLALAIPSNAVERFLNRQTPVELGVTLRPVRIPQAAGSIGLMVLGVLPASPAERSSLQIGDVLTGANGRALRRTGDLAEALDGATGGLLRLTFIRGGVPQQREVAVSLVRGVAA